MGLDNIFQKIGSAKMVFVYNDGTEGLVKEIQDKTDAPIILIDCNWFRVDRNYWRYFSVFYITDFGEITPDTQYILKYFEDYGRILDLGWQKSSIADEEEI